MHIYAIGCHENRKAYSFRDSLRRFFDSDLADCFKVPQSPLHIIIAPTREQLKETYGNLDDPELEDAFCGRVPKSVLARHYTDYSLQRLKEIYDRTNLTILG